MDCWELTKGPDAQVTNSYFDFLTSGRSYSERYGQTTSVLQTPVDYADNYVDWNIDVDDGLSRGVDDGTTGGDDTADSPWDFGTNAEYPTLKVDFDKNPDGTATVAEFGTQPRSAPTITDVRITGLTPVVGSVN